MDTVDGIGFSTFGLPQNSEQKAPESTAPQGFDGSTAAQPGGRRFKSRLAHQRERASYPEVLSLWAPAAEGGLRPSVIQMLGGSEFRLRRGFIYGKAPVRRKCAAGQKAGGVGLLYLFEILKYRF